MKKKLFQILLLILFFSQCVTLLAQNNFLSLDSSLSKIEVGKNSEIYRDSTGLETFLEIQNLPNDFWRKPENQHLSFGISTDTIWIKLNIPFDSLLNNWFLVADYSLLDEITVFKPTSQGYTTSITGRKFPFSSREVENKNFIFTLSDNVKLESPIYIKIKSETPLNCELNLYSEEGLRDRILKDFLFLGIFYGAIFIMAFYNFFLFINLKELSYLFYAISQFLAGLLSLNYESLIFQYVFPDKPDFAIHWNLIAGGLFYLFASLFGISFLRLSKYFPLGKKILYFICLLSITLLFSYFITYKYAIFIVYALGILSPLSLFLTSLVCSIRGFRPARFFLLAWLGAIISLLVFSLTQIGVFEYTYFLNHSPAIGGILEAVILSIALGDKFRLEQFRKYEEKLALASLEAFHNKITKELATAKAIQDSLVPKEFPISDQLNFQSRYLPHDAVGGDAIAYSEHANYIDFYFADVSGHGIASAFLSAMSSKVFDFVSKLQLTPADSLSEIEKQLSSIPDNLLFISCIYFRILPEQKLIEYSYGGHHSILLIREGEILALPGKGSLVLVSLFKFRNNYSFELKHNDRLVFYSYGFIEVWNKNNEILEEEGLKRIIHKIKNLPIEEFCSQLTDRVVAYSHLKPSDDMTLLAIDVN
jgi:serine phosphatase RsbU (regulator of sigma subunit)